MVAVNQEAYDTFWYWISERESIRQKKEAGLPKPWSDDPIFQDWKFCNVFRKDDKQTQALLGHLSPKHIGRPATNEDVALLIFNIYAFRAFNWDPTFQRLINDIPAGKHSTRDGWLEDWSYIMGMDSCVNTLKTNGQLTSGAYMIRGMVGMPKTLSIPHVLQLVWNKRHYLVDCIQDEPVDTMQDMYDLLMAQKFYGWGPFTTYQIVLDMTYTYLLGDAPDINTWCTFGPGAKRGLRLIYPDLESKYFVDAVREMQRNSDLKVGSHVAPLNVQDIEFALCELSKYMRIKRGGRSKATYAGRA